MPTSLSVSLCRYTRLHWLPAGCQCALVAVFYYLCSGLHMNMCIADRTIKSQGAPSPELSVSVIGWLRVIDGAWPTGQPPKSIQTAGKDEMVVETMKSVKHTCTHRHTNSLCTRSLNGPPLFKTPSIS